MSFGIIIIISILVLGINIIITSMLVAKNNVSRRLLGELKGGVQNIINELDTHIALAEDVKVELSLLLKKSENLVCTHSKSRKKTSSNITNKESSYVSKDSQNDFISQENIALIGLLLDKGESDESIIETLQVSYQEIMMVKMLHYKKQGKSSKKK